MQIKIMETCDITFHVCKVQHWIYMIQKQNKQMTTGVSINKLSATSESKTKIHWPEGQFIHLKY